MSRTAVVVHGVANRDREEFERLVDRLAGEIGTDARLVPVYWGDLGAATDGLLAAIPDMAVRSATPDDAAAAAHAQLAFALLEQRGSEIRGDPAQAVSESFAEQAGTEVRATDVDEMRQEIVDAWPALPNLAAIHDESVLREVGRALAQASDLSPELSADARPPEFEVRISLDPRRAIRLVLHGMDHAVGAVLGAAGGGLNAFLRRTVAPGIGEFLGDLLVYQRHRQTIHDRVWREIHAVDPLLGTQARPVDFFGHSLGGVIGFDMAAASEPPLWVDSLLTFGSQSPFLHVLDPRGATLAAYAGAPVPLPASIGHWTNLWEPLDPLAFIAARVFALDSGDLPDDRAVAHRATSGLWTHSTYWTAQELVDAAREALGRP